jgi:hypothetical protein
MGKGYERSFATPCGPESNVDSCIGVGQLRWRATRAKVLNLYVFSLSCAKSVVATGKMLSREA